ncbi:helix-turn-helix domain-containing protein [Mesorhizobium sp. AaZ16]|uniref:helix-turn-helix domain-containing protein n=1 Tax=Mesorhizobium sp. AaZ16 TaxID=3402289 RepID=UPI00374F57A7
MSASVIIVTVKDAAKKVNKMTDEAAGLATEEELAAALSAKVQHLRRVRNMSLDALATRAGLSKGTVVAIEQGKANPSIGVLCRLAVAFSLSVTDLLGETSQEITDNPIERTKPATLWRTPQGSAAKLEASTSGRTMFEMWTWTIAPGDVHRSEAHSRGTRELVSVQRGSLKVTVGSETIVLHAGEAARLVTDQPHSYAACDDEAVSFAMAVLERGDMNRPSRSTASPPALAQPHVRSH